MTVESVRIDEDGTIKYRFTVYTFLGRQYVAVEDVEMLVHRACELVGDKTYRLVEKTLKGCDKYGKDKSEKTGGR